MRDPHDIPDAARDVLTLLNVQQVCDLLNVKRDWVYDEVRAGHIPHVKMGRAIRFRTAELNDWISAEMVKPT